MALLINDEPIALAQGAVQRGDRTFAWEVAGAETAEYRWTEEDKDDPDGRWRARLEEDELRFEKQTKPAWADYRTVMRLTSAGVILETDQSLETLLAILLDEVAELRGLLDIALG